MAEVQQVNTSANAVAELTKGSSVTYSVTVLDKNNNTSTASVTITNNNQKLTDQDGNELGSANAADKATDEETAAAICRKPYLTHPLGAKFDPATQHATTKTLHQQLRIQVIAANIVLINLKAVQL